MATLKVVGAQIPVTGDIQANTKAIGRAMDFAVSVKADVLLTPEGSLSGYTHEFDAGAAASALEAVTARAAREGLALALGTCFVEADGRCYNQIRFYNAAGDYLGFHSKTLTCGTLTDPPMGEINHYAVKSLETFTMKGIPVGGLICNDLWANPSCTPGPDTHLTQQLARLGARVVFHAVNGGRGGTEISRISWNYHESNLQLRARASNLWIVTVDNCHPADLPCSAPSGVVNPQGFWAVKTPSQGERFFEYMVEIEGL